MTRTISKKPSEYVLSNCHFTFQDDATAYETPHLVDSDCLLWASDFPHTDSTWPLSQGGPGRPHGPPHPRAAPADPPRQHGQGVPPLGLSLPLGLCSRAAGQARCRLSPDRPNRHTPPPPPPPPGWSASGGPRRVRQATPKRGEPRCRRHRREESVISGWTTCRTGVDGVRTTTGHANHLTPETGGGRRVGPGRRSRCRWSWDSAPAAGPGSTVESQRYMLSTGLGLDEEGRRGLLDGGGPAGPRSTSAWCSTAST